MPARITCLYCGAEFPLKDRVPAGKAVRCPDCDRQFVPVEEDTNDIPARPRRRERDDDVAPRRPRREDPDDAPVRPRRRPPGDRRPRKRKVNPLVLILPAAGAAVLVIAVVLYFTALKRPGRVDPDGSRGAKYGNEMFAHLPDGVHRLRYIELEAVMNHPRLPQQIRQEIQGTRERGLRGIPPEDISVYVFGSAFGNEAVVLKMKDRPVDQNRIIALTQGRPVRYQGRDFFETRSGLMQFPADGLVTFVPDHFSRPRAPAPPMFGENALPALLTKVKGHIWSGAGSPGMKTGGGSTGPQGATKWEARLRYSFTQITLGPDAVEAITEFECFDSDDAMALAANHDGARRAEEGTNQLSRNGTKVIVRKVRPFESAQSLLRDAIPNFW